MHVLGFDPALDAQEMARRGAEGVSFDKLLRRSDIVSLHCPRNAHTVNMMNAARFAAMKPGAVFITTARSGIHDEAALADALTSGHLAGAGLDVWDQEPPPPEHLLLRLPNVVATYLSAGVTHEARRNNATLAATQIAQLLTTGEAMVGMVAAYRHLSWCWSRVERPRSPSFWPDESTLLARSVRKFSLFCLRSSVRAKTRPRPSGAAHR